MTEPTIPGAETSRAAIADLIGCYPDLTAEEVTQVLDYLRTASMLDLGILASDRAIEPQYRMLCHDHYISRPRPLLMWLGFGALVAIGLAALIVFPKFA